MIYTIDNGGDYVFGDVEIIPYDNAHKDLDSSVRLNIKKLWISGSQAQNFINEFTELLKKYHI